MVTIFAINWWALALRGVAAVLFGILAFVLPLVTLTALAFLFAAYAFLDGVLNIVAAMKGVHRSERWWVLLLEGIAGIAAGVITVAWPGITVLVLLYLVAAWAVVTGILEIMAAIRLRRHIMGEWLLALTGIASVLFGLLLATVPSAGALVIAWWIGAYVLVFGILMLALAFRLRRWTQSLQPRRA